MAAPAGFTIINRLTASSLQPFPYLTLDGNSAASLDIQTQTEAPVTFSSTKLGTQITVLEGDIVSNHVYAMGILSCYHMGNANQVDMTDVYTGQVCYLSTVVNVGLCPGERH